MILPCKGTRITENRDASQDCKLQTLLFTGPRMCADSEGPGVQTASGGSGDPTVCLDEREDVGGKHEFMECSFFQNPYPGLDGLDVL